MMGRTRPPSPRPIAMPPSQRSELQDRIQSLLGDGYRVERELPGGGMSRLFLARDLSLDRAVVVKVLPPDLAGEVNAARFQREIAVAAHLQHPHIIPILSAGADESLLYYTMPFVEGESLQQRMTREGALPATDTYRLLAEIADALAYAHTRGIVHRDVKPSNIMISGEHAVLVDFGVAQAVEEAIDITGGHFVGTTQYMAPEQFTSSDVDGRADVYSLGVVIFEVLTGRFPDEITADGPASPPRKRPAPRSLAGLRAEVPRQLSDLVEKALAAEPQARLASADCAPRRPAGRARATDASAGSTTAGRSRSRRPPRSSARRSSGAPRRDLPWTTTASPSRRSTSSRARTRSGAKGLSISSRRISMEQGRCVPFPRPS